MKPTITEATVGALVLALVLARVAAHLAGLDRYAALLAGGVPVGPWDAARGPTYCVLVVALQLAAVSVAPALGLAALLAWAWRVRRRSPKRPRRFGR